MSSDDKNARAYGERIMDNLFDFAVAGIKAQARSGMAVLFGDYYE